MKKNITNEDNAEKRGPCVVCGKWTTHKEALSHEKWDNGWRESFVCYACLETIGQQ